MKTMLVIWAFISCVAHAEYRFNGQHPIKLSADSSNNVFASVCYENDHHCSGSLRIGSTQDLSFFIQRQIFHRPDVNLSNYEIVYSKSLSILKSHKKELEKRKRELTKFSAGDPVKALALKSYVDEAEAKVVADNRAIAYLEEGKKKALLFDQEFQETISGENVMVFDRTYSYGIEHFLFNRCQPKENRTDCWHAGLQFFLKQRSSDLEDQLIAKTIREENFQHGYPAKLSNGLQLALLSTNISRFGTRHPSQSTGAVTMEVEDNSKAKCLATNQTGTLNMTQVGCEALGKNWRFPTLKELSTQASEIRSHLPELDSSKLFQTMNVNGFVNPGAAHLIVCKPVYFNLTTQKTLNNQVGIVRSFIFGKDPGEGVGGLCVCEKNC